MEISTTLVGPPMTRRRFLGSLAALAALPPALSRCGDAAAPIAIQGLNHATLAVRDPLRSLEFYQRLFGMPVQARQATTPCLRIGDGPQFMALAKSGANVKQGIHHLCMAVDGFEADTILRRLAAHGVETASEDAAGVSGGPLRARLRRRGPAYGGAAAGTPELYLGDPDGIVVQLQDTSYCGGSGTLGEVCSIEPTPGEAPLPVRGINHFTVFVSDAQRSMDFYQRVFGLPITMTQGSMPLLDAGPNGQLLGFVDAGRRTTGAFIHHVCLTIQDFHHERVFAALERHGLTRVDDPLGGPIPPLSTYVTMRMPDRGGAPDGTPELYLTDPDGILIQIQDERYCGGAGYLGEECAYV